MNKAKETPKAQPSATEPFLPAPGQQYYVERSRDSNSQYCIRKARTQVRSWRDPIVPRMERLSLDVAMSNCSKLNEGKIKEPKS